MLKILILQTQHNLADARIEYMIRDHLSWMAVPVGRAVAQLQLVRLLFAELTCFGVAGEKL